MVAIPSDRIQYLDSLRGLAALWVLILHVAMMPKPIFSLPEWFAPYVQNGHMGVELFFVVSAYSLCLSMRGHEKEQRPMVGFALRRFFRIAPLFYVMVLVTAFFNPIGYEYTWKSILTNVLFIFNFFPGYGYQTSVVLAGWTIGVEMAFYMLFPFIYARVTNVWLAVGGALAAIVLSYVFLAVLPIFVTEWQTYNMYSIFYRLPIFMFGLIAFFWLPKLKNTLDNKSIGTMLICAAVLIFHSIIYKKVPFFEPYHWTGAAFACLLVGVGLNPVRFIVNKVTAWLGKISYSIYLLHSPIIVLLFPVYKKMQAMDMPVMVTYFSAVALTLLIVIPLASVVFYSFEQPINNFGRKLANKYAGRVK